MQLFHCTFLHTLDSLYLKQKRLTFEAEVLPGTAQNNDYQKVLDAKVREAKNGPEKGTDPKTFFDKLITDTNTIKEQTTASFKDDRESINSLNKAVSETQNQIKEARREYEKNDEYLHCAVEARIGIDNAFTSYNYWKKATDLSCIGTVLGHLKHTSDSLRVRRANMEITAPADAKLAKEKSELITYLSNCIESLHGLGESLPTELQKELSDHDDLIKEVKTAENPDPVKVRELRSVSDYFNEAFDNLGNSIPDELLPLSVALGKKIDEVGEVLRDVDKTVIQNSPELKKKDEIRSKKGKELEQVKAAYNKLLNNPKALEDDKAALKAKLDGLQQELHLSSIDFQLARIKDEAGLLLEEIALSNPPSLDSIRLLEANINEAQQAKEKLGKSDQQKSPVQELLKKADTLIAHLNDALNKAREVYLKSEGSPAEIVKMMTDGNNLAKAIKACKEKIAKAAPNENIEALFSDLENLQKQQRENNAHLQSKLNDIEKTRLIKKVQQKGGPVFYKDIQKLEEINSEAPNGGFDALLLDAQIHFINQYPKLKPLADALIKASNAYNKAAEEYEKVKDEDVNDPARKQAEKKLQIAQANYYAAKNKFADRARGVDMMQMHIQNQKKSEIPTQYNEPLDAGEKSARTRS